MSIRKLTTRRPLNKKDRAVIADLVTHLVKAIDPVKIYLIGSATRNELHADSDLDFVIVSEKSATDDASQIKIHSTRPHKNQAVDFICVKLSEFEKQKNIGGICFEAFRHGQLLFEKALA